MPRLLATRASVFEVSFDVRDIREVFDEWERSGDRPDRRGEAFLQELLDAILADAEILDEMLDVLTHFTVAHHYAENVEDGYYEGYQALFKRILGGLRSRLSADAKKYFGKRLDGDDFIASPDGAALWGAFAPWSNHLSPILAEEFPDDIDLPEPPPPELPPPDLVVPAKKTAKKPKPS